MVVTARPLSPALMPFVASFRCEGDDLPAALERVLPGGGAAVMVNLYEDAFRTYHGPDHGTVRHTRGAVLAGPCATATVIDTRLQRRLVSVAFRPGGAAHFFAAPLRDARDRLVDLGDLWGSDASELRERLLQARGPGAMFLALEDVLLRHLRPDAADPVVPAALAALARGARVSTFAAHAGLSPSSFYRRFVAGVGLSPKTFARVWRVQRLLRCVCPGGDNDWAGLAAEHGYADQAHLVHDFGDITGLTPGIYRPRAPNERNHVPLAAPRG